MRTYDNERRVTVSAVTFFSTFAVLYGTTILGSRVMARVDLGQGRWFDRQLRQGFAPTLRALASELKARP